MLKTYLKYIAVFIFALGIVNDGYAQCTNCGSQYPAATQSTTSSTLTDVSTCMFGGDYAVFDVTAGETYTWKTCSDASFDTQLTLFQGSVGCAGGSLTFNDNDCGLQSTITWTATFTGQVNVLVSEYNCISNSTCMTLQWACTSCGGGGSAPTNNDCSGATSLPCGTSNLSGTTDGSTSGTSDAGCLISDYGVWYTFTGNGQQTTVTADPESGYDFEMAVASGSCGSLTNIACEDDGLSGDTETYTFVTNSGTTYYVYLAYWSSSGASTETGNFTISRTCTTVSVPPNDDCAGATPVGVNTDGSCSITESGTIEFASPSSQTNGCFGTANNDVWFSFVATETNMNIELQNISGSTSDLYHSVYAGNCGALGAALVCSVPNSSSVTGLTVGNTYYVRVFSYSGNQENTTFDICIHEDPPAVAQDCAGGTTVCSDASFSGNSSGSGATADLSLSNEGCLAGENESSWYFFSPQTSGTIELTINTSVDYDFAIWGPMANASCPPTGSPIRCSYAADPGNTGLQAGSGDQSEGVVGDRFVDPINVTAGEEYIMLIDNYTADGSSFSFDWSLSNGASLDCTALSSEDVDFQAKKQEDQVTLQWEKTNETNTDYFEIEKGSRKGHFQAFKSVQYESSNNEELKTFLIKDGHPLMGTSYYRLKEISNDGTVINTKTASVNFQSDKKYSLYPNPAKNLVMVNAVNTNDDEKIIQINNVYGQSIKKIKTASWRGDKEINTSNLANGVYLIAIYGKKNNLLFQDRIVINH